MFFDDIRESAFYCHFKFLSFESFIPWKPVCENRDFGCRTDGSGFVFLYNFSFFSLFVSFLRRDCNPVKIV